MSNLSKVEFLELDISGKKFLTWMLDAKIHLTTKNLGDTICEENDASVQDKAKAMIFLRHHLHEDLKREYLTIDDPYEMWKNIQERFDHQKLVLLPKARYDWLHLRLQDFKSIFEYSSVLFSITSILKLCKEPVTDKDMIEKTLSTFHTSNVLLSEQYRGRGFTKYCDLLSCLLLAEQNKELLVRNHEARPIGSTPLPEVNVATTHGGRGRGRGRGPGRGRGRGRSNTWQRDSFNPKHSKGKINHNDVGRNSRDRAKQGQSVICYKCGMTNHWSRTCRTPKHLVEAYQRMMKEDDKGKHIETNLIEIPNSSHSAMPSDVHLDVSDFMAN